MKNKKRRLRKWVRVTIGIISGAACAALFFYLFFGAVLQTSYRYSSPRPEEIVEARQEGGLWSWITLAKY
jgi:hypothetical protein